MTFPWNLLNRFACMHCYLMGRYPDGWRDTRWQALRTARNCAKTSARRSRMAVVR